MFNQKSLVFVHKVSYNNNYVSKLRGFCKMEWIRVTIYTTTFGIDLICSTLSDLGINGVEIEDANDFNEFLENNAKYWDYVDDELMKEKQGETKIKFYFENNGSVSDRIAQVKSALSVLKKDDNEERLGRLETETDGLNEEDWANNWKKYFKPIEVGEKILIQPEWCPYEKDTDRTVFTVNPGLAFGTGTHTSTRLCICELEKAVNEDTVLLDAGCGSGILSVIALMLGAKEAAAVDIDENCVHVALENAERNGVDTSKYHVYSGDIASDEELFKKISIVKYDVIVANIVADVIIALLPTVKKLIKQGGTFICSGIINERLDDVLSAMKTENIDVSSVVKEDGWAAVTCKF